jgi:predicted naringenin-chalcone synthase
MSYILDIATGVPDYTIGHSDLERFYMEVIHPNDNNYFLKKLRFINRRTSIVQRYSCIPDYNGTSHELYKDRNYQVTVDERMEIYKRKILPLAAKVIDRVFSKTAVSPAQVTHLITVSCTGQSAPGMEFLVAEHYGMLNVEKVRSTSWDAMPRYAL